MSAIVPWAEILSQSDSQQDIDVTNSRAQVAIFQVPPARPGFAAGGSQVVTMSLAQALVSIGYRVLLFSGTTDGVGTEYKSDGIWYRSAFQITKHVLEEGEPQIEFIGNDWQLLERCSVAFMFDRVFRLPQHIESILILDTAAYGFAQSAATSKNWSQMIVPSEYMFHQVEQMLRSSGQAARLKRVHVVANPLNASHLGLSGELPQLRFRPGETIRLLFPHRADQDKGIKESVRLLSRMSRLRDTVLTILVDQSTTAEPNLYGSVVEMVRSMDLSSMVEFVPWQPLSRMGQLYASVDVTLCIGYFPEGFGLVCLESILCGTPVVARKAGAQTQLLPPGHGCFIVPEDESELAQFVCDLVADPSLPNQVLRGRAYIQRNYSTESFLKNFLTIAGLH
jgi:glycosyltransferase involved in cell wall biosynthesis